MARRLDDKTPPTGGDRVLLALILLACSTFLAAVLWLLLGSR
ncbi:MAG: hypothetical protein ACRDGM_01315 [bacterium]